LKLALGPIALETFGFVESTFDRVVKADEFDDLTPGKADEQIGGKNQCAGRFPHQWCGFLAHDGRKEAAQCPLFRSTANARE
jgi:hypothetical protein